MFIAMEQQPWPASVIYPASRVGPTHWTPGRAETFNFPDQPTKLSFPAAHPLQGRTRSANSPRRTWEHSDCIWMDYFHIVAGKVVYIER